jgi:hypothetical protein
VAQLIGAADGAGCTGPLEAPLKTARMREVARFKSTRFIASSF